MRLLEDIYVAYAAALNDVFIHALDSPWLDQLNMQAKDDIAIDKKIILKEWYTVWQIITHTVNQGNH